MAEANSISSFASSRRPSLGQAGDKDSTSPACPGSTQVPAGLVSLPAVGGQGLRGQALTQPFGGPILDGGRGAVLGFGPTRG